jgi:hypothetical protein
VIISNNHRIHYTEKQNRNQTMYIKFLKSNEGKKGINIIKFVETHSNFFNTTELVWILWPCKITDTTTVRRGRIKVDRK